MSTDIAVRPVSPGPTSVFLPLGDQAVRIRFGNEISPETAAQVRQFCRALERSPVRGVIEWVPAYAAVAVYYRPWVLRYPEICAELAVRLSNSEGEAPLPARTVQIPVRYGDDSGPDLEEVARRHSLTTGEVIKLHTQPSYLVYMLGFAPGFPYLGGLPESLATPRLATPRALVPAGSVGIGGSQTGVYPFATPGGWRIIGRTRVTLYAIDRDPPALLQAGDRVQFFAEE